MPVLLMNPATKEETQMARRKRTTRKKSTARRKPRRKTAARKTRRAAPRRKTTTRKVTRRRTKRRKNPAMGDLFTAGAAGVAVGLLQTGLESGTELDTKATALAMGALGIIGGAALKKQSKPLSSAIAGAGMAFAAYSGAKAVKQMQAEKAAMSGVRGPYGFGMGAVEAPLPGGQSVTMNGVAAPIPGGVEVMI